MFMVSCCDSPFGAAIVLQRLGCSILGSISLERDRDCRRLQWLRWPGTISWDDMVSPMRDFVRALAAPRKGLVDVAVFLQFMYIRAAVSRAPR